MLLDTIDYKRVMTDYGLGPNGAIITSLNLLCTRMDQVNFYLLYLYNSC